MGQEDTFRRITELVDRLSPEGKEALEHYLGGKEKALYSPEQFAAVTGIPVARIRRWLREGHIKGKKISRSWLIPHSEVDRVLKVDWE